MTTLDKEELLREVAVKVSGTRLDAYGKPIVTSADEAGKANVYYWYLDKYASSSISEIAADINRAFGTIEYTDAVDLVQIAILNSFEYNWMKSSDVTYDFLNKVIQVADKLGTSPDNLMTVMAVESGLNPQCGNSSSPVGLIQFTESSIDNINRNNGTNYSKEDILNMDGIQQLDLVYLHCKGQGDLSDLGDLYMSLFCPKAVGQDDDFELYCEGSKEYEKNKILDLNNDGIITRREVMDKVYEKRAEYE